MVKKLNDFVDGLFQIEVILMNNFIIYSQFTEIVLKSFLPFSCLFSSHPSPFQVPFVLMGTMTKPKKFWEKFENISKKFKKEERW